MSHIKNIFTRATIRGVADYLLFGNGSDDDDRHYEERMEEIYLRFEKAVAKYDSNPNSELLDLCNELTSETQCLYGNRTAGRNVVKGRYGKECEERWKKQIRCCI